MERPPGHSERPSLTELEPSKERFISDLYFLIARDLLPRNGSGATLILRDLELHMHSMTEDERYARVQDARKAIVRFKNDVEALLRERLQVDERDWETITVQTELDPTRPWISS
jgi:hypothetical protein